MGHLPLEHAAVNLRRIFLERGHVFGEFRRVDTPRAALNLRDVVLRRAEPGGEFALRQSFVFAQFGEHGDEGPVSSGAQSGLRQDDASQQVSEAS